MALYYGEKKEALFKTKQFIINKLTLKNTNTQEKKITSMSIFIDSYLSTFSTLNKYINHLIKNTAFSINNNLFAQNIQ